jgi:hypothetical protein
MRESKRPRPLLLPAETKKAATLLEHFRVSFGPWNANLLACSWIDHNRVLRGKAHSLRALHR